MSQRDLSFSAVRAIRENRILRNVYLWMSGGLVLTAAPCRCHLIRGTLGQTSGG